MTSPPSIVAPTASSERLAPVNELMRSAVAEGVFPGAVLLISRDGRILCHQAYGLTNLETRRRTTIDTVYDLASLTKPLATTLAVLKLVAAGSLTLESRLWEVLPAFVQTDKATVKVRHLLCHTAGLPSWRPYYRSLSTLPPADRPAALQARLVQESLVSKPGAECCYSDLGFMILHWLVESISGQGLDHFVRGQLYRPLGIRNLLYIPLNRPQPQLDYAATERCPWRKCLLSGAVHDENAYAIGGIAGQSGLFGTAAAVHELLSALIALYHERGESRLLPSKLVQRSFARCGGGRRALGFDCPDPTGSSSGGRFSENSVGHLGYTGTSFWIDLDRKIIVTLLSNRIHPSRTNEAIKLFRPVLHDMIMSGLLDE